MINTIAREVLLENFSCKKTRDSSGTNIYPNASNIGRSLTFTPWAKAIILITTEQKNIPYAKMTRLFSISVIFEECSTCALFFRSICEHEERNTPTATNM